MRRAAVSWLVLVVAVSGSVLAATHVSAAGRHEVVNHGRHEVTPATRSARRPNVMVVMLDDMRSDELRFAPNARRFVRHRGVDFVNSFAPYPLCCPARASFLLGKYAHNHHVLYHEAPFGFGSLDDSRTLATTLRSAGYNTAMVGKYLNRYGVQRSKVTGRSSVHYQPAGWTDWKAGLDTIWPTGSKNAGNTYDYFAFTQNINGRVVPHPGQYSSTVIANQVLGLIGKYHRSARPFFLWITPVAPHHGSPVEPDDPATYTERNGHEQTFVTPARPDWVKGRFDRAITHSPGQPVHRPAEAHIGDKPQNVRKHLEATATEKSRLRDVERQRAESIYAWDREFGRIVTKLKRTGEYDDTVIMFTSDNGYYLGEHRQRTGKIKAHEPVLHVPLLVAGPGIQHGRRFAPITTFDLTSTIIELAGARPLPAMDGESKLSVMTGRDRAWTYPLVTEGRLPEVHTKVAGFRKGGLTTVGIRTGRYKYIRYANGDIELYDLLRDPNELTSLTHDPRYARARAELQTLWLAYKECKRSACRAPMPAPYRSTTRELAVQARVARQKWDAYYNH